MAGFGIFAVVGLGLLVRGIFAVQHTRHFLHTAVSVLGVVTENVWRGARDSNNRISWAFYPRIRFRTADGQEITFITNTGASPPCYRLNEPVTILYDPQQTTSPSCNECRRATRQTQRGYPAVRVTK